MGYSKQFVGKVNDGSAGPTVKNLMQYNVDTEAEITGGLVPIDEDVAAGSCALAINSGELYMINSLRAWAKVGA